MGRLKLFTLFLTLALFASPSFAARQALDVTVSPSSRGSIKDNAAKTNANFIELYAADLLKANTSAFASQAAFTAAWGWTPGGISAWSDVQALITGSGDYVKYDGTRGTPPVGATAINDLTDVDTTGKATGKILKFDASGNLVVGDDSTGSGTLPPGTEGQTIQYDSGGNPAAVAFAPLAFTDNVSRNTTTGVVSVPVTSTATSGSAVPFTSGGAYTAIGGKQNTLVSGTSIKTINSISLLGAGNIDIASGTGGYVSLSAAPYSDAACTTGQYGYYGSTAYLCTGGFWASKWTLATHSNPTPVTYSLTITPSGFTGADKFTYNSTDYTAEQAISGLTADASFTVTPDTGRTITCTGTGLTDNTGGSYTANTDTANVVATCTSTASSITDSFGTDVNPLASPWAKPVFTSSNPLKALGGVVTATVNGAENSAYWSTWAGGADQCSQITVVAGGTTPPGIGVRQDPNADTRYALHAGHIYKRVAGVQTDLFGDAALQMANGDTEKICVSGTSTATITIYKNGSLIKTQTDSSSPITTGFPFIRITATNATADNWSASSP